MTHISAQQWRHLMQQLRTCSWSMTVVWPTVNIHSTITQNIALWFGTNGIQPNQTNNWVTREHCQQPPHSPKYQLLQAQTSCIQHHYQYFPHALSKFSLQWNISGQLEPKQPSARTVFPPTPHPVLLINMFDPKLVDEHQHHTIPLQKCSFTWYTQGVLHF